MLKRIRLVILILITIIWFIIILPYFLIQTDFGAKYTSQLISYYNQNYSISLPINPRAIGELTEIKFCLKLASSSPTMR